MVGAAVTCKASASPSYSDPICSSEPKEKGQGLFYFKGQRNNLWEDKKDPVSFKFLGCKEEGYGLVLGLLSLGRSQKSMKIILK